MKAHRQMQHLFWYSFSSSFEFQADCHWLFKLQQMNHSEPQIANANLGRQSGNE